MVSPDRSWPASSLDCAFCAPEETLDGQSRMLYADAQVYAMLDRRPMARGHALVVLREHHADLSTVPPGQAAHLGEVVARLSKALKEGLGASSIYVAALGELVPHVHYHLIPRYAEDKKGFVHFLSPRRDLADPDRLVRAIQQHL